MEFGAEFEELLQRSPLSLPVVANVISGGIGEHMIAAWRRLIGQSAMSDRALGARYDWSTKLLSAFVVVLLISVLAIAFRPGAAIALAAIGLGFAFSPRGYEISGGMFRVKRLIGDVVFPLEGLRFVRVATAADFWGCVRLWGSGGLFGYYGWYWSRALGRTRWYVTDRSNAVVITDGKKNILVSPEDREGFLSAIRKSDEKPVAVTTESESGRKTSQIVWLALTVGTLSVVAAAVLYSPGRPPVDLTSDSLVIHSRFYGMTVAAKSVDAPNIRVVDLQTEPGWKTVLRVGGIGGPFYRAGNFRTANGKTIKLFSTGTQRLVLLPPSAEDGTPVLLDTEEPDRFVEQVREAWVGR